MFKNGAQRLTENLIVCGIVSEKDSELYRYGFEIGFSMLANILTTITIGVLLKMPLESLIFLAAFIPVRSYVGGFHASNHFRCYWFSVFAVVVVLLAARLFVAMLNTAAIIGLGAICVILMFALVPVQDANRPLDAEAVYVFKRKARIVLAVELAVLAVLTVIGPKAIASVLLCTLCLTCISTCVGTLKNYANEHMR